MLKQENKEKHRIIYFYIHYNYKFTDKTVQCSTEHI